MQTLTGRYFDGWPYNSAPGYSPYLWLAFYLDPDVDPASASEAYISGRMYAAPGQSGG